MNAYPLTIVQARRVKRFQEKSGAKARVIGSLGHHFVEVTSIVYAGRNLHHRIQAEYTERLGLPLARAAAK